MREPKFYFVMKYIGSNPFPLEGYESRGISKPKQQGNLAFNSGIISKSLTLRVFKFTVENLDHNSGFHVFFSNIVIS